MDIIRRWLTRAIGIPYKKRWAEHLGPTQFAVGRKAGIDKIVHTLNCIIQGAHFSEYCVGEIDGITLLILPTGNFSWEI